MMEDEDLELLKQAEKLNPTTTSRSQLITYAVRQVFTNKLETLRNKRKEAQKELMRLTDEIKLLEETKGEQ